MKFKRLDKFTLVELLVVVAIISLLMALLMPALGKSREMARKTQCAGQLKSIGLSAQLYLDDYNGHWFYSGLPDGHVWYMDWPCCFANECLKIKWSSGDYWKGTILDCPSKQGGYGGGSVDYMYNSDLTISNCEWFGRVARLKRPACTVMFGETTRYSGFASNCFVFQRWQASANGNTDPGSGDATFDWNTHNGTDNFLFVDGHVAAHHRAEQMDKSTFVFDTRQE